MLLSFHGSCFTGIDPTNSHCGEIICKEIKCEILAYFGYDWCHMCTAINQMKNHIYRTSNTIFAWIHGFTFKDSALEFGLCLIYPPSPSNLGNVGLFWRISLVLLDSFQQKSPPCHISRQSLTDNSPSGGDKSCNKLRGSEQVYWDTDHLYFLYHIRF